MDPSTALGSRANGHGSAGVTSRQKTKTGPCEVEVVLPDDGGDGGTGDDQEDGGSSRALALLVAVGAGAAVLFGGQ